MITYIGFVPGLDGDKSLAVRSPAPAPGTYAYAVSEVAQELGLPFYRIDFQAAADNPAQTPAKRFPRLSEIGVEIASQTSLLSHAHRGRGLIVASSAGAGGALQGVLNMVKDGHPLPYLLLFKPGVDPIDLISQRMTAAGAGKYVDMLKAGQLPELGIPVDPNPTCPDPGKYILTPAHMNDADALRLVTEDKSRAYFCDAFAETKIPKLHVVTAAEDSMFTVQIADMFEQVARASTDEYSLILLSGDRSDDHSPQLQQHIRFMVRQAAL